MWCGVVWSPRGAGFRFNHHKDSNIRIILVRYISLETLTLETEPDTGTATMMSTVVKLCSSLPVGLVSAALCGARTMPRARCLPRGVAYTRSNPLSPVRTLCAPGRSGAAVRAPRRTLITTTHPQWCRGWGGLGSGVVRSVPAPCGNSWAVRIAATRLSTSSKVVKGSAAPAFTKYVGRFMGAVHLVPDGALLITHCGNSLAVGAWCRTCSPGV